ncbi:MAG: pyroglutamyl-peptidase I [Ectothiorhodospiraceae bacterium]|nr:pyroglutamyl-peptidase I [Ectothiorhodospiraceae bacterium]
MDGRAGREPTVLLTGFGPFADVDHNPTAAVVARLARGRPSAVGARIVAHELPVDYARVGDVVAGLVADVSPDAILLTGLRTSALTVGVERVALNLDDTVEPDNAGRVRRGTPIATSGPPAYISPLDLEPLCAAFLERGIAAGISNHAGAYLCNHTYYRTRHLLAATRPQVPCVFVHVPWIGRHPVVDARGEAVTEAMLADALVACAVRLADVARVGEGQS